MYVCLLRPITVMCALDMLLIKETYLLTYLLFNSVLLMTLPMSRLR